MIKKIGGIIKTDKDICPNCGHKNRQINQSGYPMYDSGTDTITKFFICNKCLTEYYEKFTLNYAGCEALELPDIGYGYEKVIYDINGNKI